MAVNNRNAHTEYGGGPGAPQRHADGSLIEVSPRLAARPLRQEGMAGDVDLGRVDQDPPEMNPAKERRILDEFFGTGDTGLTPAEYREQERRRLKARSNGYVGEVGTGDQIA